MELAEVENNLVSPSSILKHNVEALKTRNKELNVDISILKRLVYMLNVELELRDSKKEGNRSELESQHDSVVAFSFKPNQILQWNHDDIVMIDPLLRAFQQMKEEKDQLVTNYKSIFEDLSTRCKTIILENDTLREELRNTKAKANSSYAEWKKLHQEFLLVKEHNQLMTRQIKLFQSKVRSIESVYKTSLKQYETERQDLMEKFDATKTELLVLKGRFSVLTQVSNQIKHQNEDLNDANFYNIITKEIQDLSVELKLHNAKDTDWMKKKIADLENEKASTDVEIAKLSSERDHLKGYISAVESEARKLNSRYEELERELQVAKKSQGDARKQIIKCMAFIRELVGVHNVLLDQVSKPEN
ncbi:centrosomal protein of 89 kDa-like isoform X2 [Planococcus citri]|uniref:centrosomal protein of 89 kDa-like isoform X2 n=1 Tax=Planococcus citri TaxID=170843 RepID=UPI0031F77610